MTIEVWVVVDENGDYATGTDQAAAALAYSETIGAPDIATRHVKLVLAVALPEPITLTGEVPAEVRDGTLRVG